MNSREMNREIKQFIGMVFFETNPAELEEWRGRSPYELLKEFVIGENHTEASEKRFNKALEHVNRKVLGTISPQQIKELRRRWQLDD